MEKTTPVSLLKKIVGDFHAELHVIDVEHHQRNADNAKGHVSFSINDLLQDTRAEFHPVEEGEITEAISWFVKRSKLDLLVVMPRKHKLLQGIFRRSHTKELVYHTHIPVLCIHE